MSFWIWWIRGFDIFVENRKSWHVGWSYEFERHAERGPGHWSLTLYAGHRIIHIDRIKGQSPLTTIRT